MRILLIHNYYQQPGGEDQVFEAEGKLLEEHGHIVERLVFDNNSIRSWRQKIAMATGVIYNRASSRKLKEKIESFHPDVIHVHNFVVVASPSIFFTAKKYGVPVVLTLHNYRLLCPSATLFFKQAVYDKSVHAFFPVDAIIKGVYRNSRWQTAALALMTAFHNGIGTWRNKIDRYIVLTEFAREKFIGSTLRIPNNKFALKPNFVADYGEGKIIREDYFLFVGRLTVEKGIHTLLNAAQAEKFNLTMVGDGPLRNIVEERARACTNIRYLGFLRKEDMLVYLKECKALIFPSIWYEGLPVTILEAFSTGTPVIASRLGSMMEIIQDQVNGLHFDPDNVNDLLQTVRRMNDATLAKRLSVNARATYLKKFTAEVNYERLLTIYKEVCVPVKREEMSGVKYQAA